MSNLPETRVLTCAGAWLFWSLAFAGLALLCIGAAAWGPKAVLVALGTSLDAEDVRRVSGPVGLAAMALGFVTVSMLAAWASFDALLHRDVALQSTLSPVTLAAGVLTVSVIVIAGLVQPVGWLPLLSGTLLLGLAATGFLTTIAGRAGEVADDARPVGGLQQRTSRAVELALLSERLASARRGKS